MQRDLFPDSRLERNANMNYPEVSKLAAASKALRNAANRLADIRGEGGLVTQLRREAARVERKRKLLLKAQDNG